MLMAAPGACDPRAVSAAGWTLGVGLVFGALRGLRAVAGVVPGDARDPLIFLRRAVRLSAPLLALFAAAVLGGPAAMHALTPPPSLPGAALLPPFPFLFALLVLLATQTYRPSCSRGRSSGPAPLTEADVAFRARSSPVDALACLHALACGYLVVASLRALGSGAPAHALASALALAAAAVVTAGLARSGGRARELVVGVDGVHVPRGREGIFLRYDEISSAVARGASVVLTGESRTRGQWTRAVYLEGDDVTLASAVAARIRQRQDEAHRAEVRVDERQLAALVAMEASGQHVYRLPALSRAGLWRLVEGGSTPPSLRLAAARRLVAVCSGDGGERERIALAASRCAEPRLRAELQTIARESARQRSYFEPRRVA